MRETSAYRGAGWNARLAYLHPLYTKDAERKHLRDEGARRYYEGLWLHTALS